MEIKEAFGLALKEARLAKGLTQEDFSVVSSRTYISTLERNIYSPSLEKVDDIARHIGIHPLTLITMSYLKMTSDGSVETLHNQIDSEIRELMK